MRFGRPSGIMLRHNAIITQFIGDRIAFLALKT